MNHNLAVKALNQYRRRDIFPYLGIRYYLESVSARESRWINEISCRLTAESEQSSYLRIHHFKECKDGEYFHRDIYLPAPNEALAETALITEISKFTDFQSKNFVFSYRFTSENDKSGVFRPYFDGLKERQKFIAEACRCNGSECVLYADIKKFYPSIKSNDALSLWERLCNKAKIDKRFKDLGKQILIKHAEISIKDSTGKGILTGPIFSHVIANLLLDSIDVKMNEITNGKYCRYVDDVVLVGTCENVEKWRTILKSSLEELDLELHDGKDLVVSCLEWIKGESDFETSAENLWINLIASVKRFLLGNPNKSIALKKSFEQNQIRIPVVDYLSIAKSSSYSQRVIDWIKRHYWARGSVKKIDIAYLLQCAEKCKRDYMAKINELLEMDHPLTKYELKRLIPKLRYFSGRLLYLCERAELLEISNKLINFPELFQIAKSMEAIATKNVTEILLMGSNATHVIAQLLRATNSTATIDNIDKMESNEVFEESVAVLEVNGVAHDYSGERSDLRRLSKADDVRELMKAKDVFIKEFACLHGVFPSRHKQMLESSFDRDEELALDALNLIHQYSHC